jgi:autotransporter strand-loop-strand O-heptosyltransferase
MINFVTRFRDDYTFLNIVGDSDDRDFYVEFIDLSTNEVKYSDMIKVNYWTQIDSTPEMCILIRVTSEDKIIFERKKTDKFNRVYVIIGSNSLGDNIAFVPCVEEYRKINNVEVILYTYHKNLFDKVYTDIIFTDISDSNYINDVDKKFRIDFGPELYMIDNVLSSEYWYADNKKYDNAIKTFDYRKYSLQSIANLILGIPDQEYVSKINIPEGETKIKGKYVVVAIQSTSQLKYWNNPFGWERLFDFLGRNGYKIVLIDKYKSFGILGHYNQAPKSKYVIDKTGNYPLSERITDIKYAKMMITISSGLAWVSWAVGTPVVLVSGFTKPWLEFKSNCTRIYNSNVCNGCWNDSNITFDASNWMFCPKNNDFICSKAIQPKDVIDGVKKYMN